MSKFFQALQRAEQEQTLQRRPLEERPSIEQSGAPARRPFAVTAARDITVRRKQQHDRSARSTVVDSPSSIDEHLVSLLTPTIFEAEQYRTLWQSIEQLYGEKDLSVIAISSPTVGDGKSTTAINMAGSFAQLPARKVLLVDVDYRHPSVASQLGFPCMNTPELVDALMNQKLTLSDIVQPCRNSTLEVVTINRAVEDPHPILKAQRFGELLEEARRSYDCVILDMPPLIPFPDCRAMEKWVDGFMVVVAAHKTPRKLIKEAVDTLNPEKLLGLVFNNDDRPVFGYHTYYTYDDARGAKKNWLTRAVRKLKASLSCFIL
ncbi:MAG: tyrosine-protein kinase family protein [Candidatus Binatia bacterium]